MQAKFDTTTHFDSHSLVTHTRWDKLNFPGKLTKRNIGKFTKIPT